MFSKAISREVLQNALKKCRIEDVSTTGIRDVRKLVDVLEEESKISFIRMEMGIPGMEPPQMGLAGEKKGLDEGCAQVYPNHDGIAPLKKEMKLFAKNFINLDLSEENCIPTVGSLQGSFSCFLTCVRRNEKQKKILFLDPAFPVHKQQARLLGVPFECFDMVDYRGEALYEKIDSYLKQGDIGCILYSNPNNPTWMCLSEEELKGIGELSLKYDVVVIEDLAYFGLDSRKDITIPGEAPYQLSVAHYTDKYVLLVSTSKSFSYAGQRIGMMFLSDALAASSYPFMKNFFPTDRFGYNMVTGSLYAMTAGVTHSAQYGLCAMLEALNTKKWSFKEIVNEYCEKAKVMKTIFTQNGFSIIYDKDGDENIADGFYFTIGYQEMSAKDLLEELLRYGVSAISLLNTGASRSNGLRACVSLVQKNQFPHLQERLELFAKEHL